MKPSFVRPTTALAGLALAAVGVISVAEPASAAVTRHDGSTRFNWGRNCESVIYGYPYVEAAAGLVASVLYDDAAPPKVGEVFYVVIEGAGIGNPYPCVGQKMRPRHPAPRGGRPRGVGGQPDPVRPMGLRRRGPGQHAGDRAVPDRTAAPGAGWRGQLRHRRRLHVGHPHGSGLGGPGACRRLDLGLHLGGVRGADRGRRGQPRDQRDLGPRPHRSRLVADPHHPDPHPISHRHRPRHRRPASLPPWRPS